MRYSIQPRNKDMNVMVKDMNFCLLLKIWVKIYAINVVNTSWYAKKSTTDPIKTASKEQFKKQQKQLVV